MNILNKIINKDVLDGLKDIPDDIVSLTITSPSYNLKINYDSIEDDQPYADYLEWLKTQAWDGKLPDQLTIINSGGSDSSGLPMILQLATGKGKVE